MSRRETEQIDWNRRSNVSPASFKISTFRSIIYIAERYRPLKSILSAFYRKRKSGIMCGHAIWNRITFTVKSFTTIPPFGERRSLTLLFLLNRRDENLYRFETTMHICVVFCHLFKYTGEKYWKNKRSNENDIYAI